MRITPLAQIKRLHLQGGPENQVSGCMRSSVTEEECIAEHPSHQGLRCAEIMSNGIAIALGDGLQLADIPWVKSVIVIVIHCSGTLLSL